MDAESGVSDRQLLACAGPRQSPESDSIAILPLLTRGLLTWPPRRSVARPSGRAENFDGALLACGRAIDFLFEIRFLLCNGHRRFWEGLRDALDHGFSCSKAQAHTDGERDFAATSG